MKKTIVVLFVLTYLSSCDYSTSSNGNIDAAFAREPIEHTGISSHHDEQKSESDHGHETESGAAGEVVHPEGSYDTTTVGTQGNMPTGKVVAVDTINPGSKGQKVLKNNKKKKDKK